jgi:hypothetical protein
VLEQCTPAECVMPTGASVRTKLEFSSDPEGQSVSASSSSPHPAFPLLLQPPDLVCNSLLKPASSVVSCEMFVAKAVLVIWVI